MRKKFKLPVIKLPPNFFPSGEEPVITTRDMDLYEIRNKESK